MEDNSYGVNTTGYVDPFKRTYDSLRSRPDLIDGYAVASQDPTFREQLIQRNPQAALPNVRGPRDRQQRDLSFTEGFGVAWQQYSFYANSQDIFDLETAQIAGENRQIPDSELLRGVPQQFHSAVLNQQKNFNTDAALVFRDQLLEDIENNGKLEDMGILSQFGYGALVMLTDPTTYAIGVPAGGVASAGVSALSRTSAWASSRLFQNTAVLAGWGAGAAMDSAIYNLPRLGGGDHTYDSTDYMIDVASDAALGVAIGGVVTGISSHLRKKRQEHAAELESHARRVLEDMENPPDTSSVTHGVDNEIRILEGRMQELTQARVDDIDARTESIQRDIEQLEARRQEMIEGERLQISTPTQYVELTEVPRISNEGFQSVHKLAKQSMDRNSPLLAFMNRQNKLLSELPEGSPELRIAHEINADLVKLAAAYPDGRVPASVRSTMNRLRMAQSHMIRNDAMERLSGLRKGDTVSDRDLTDLITYNDVLARNPVFEGYDPVPMNYAELSATMGNVIDVVRTPRTEQLPTGAKEYLDIGLEIGDLPSELRFIRDLLDLNEAAIRSGNARLMEEVNRLNGLTAARLEQLEFLNKGQVRDGQWAANQVLAEGLVPGTPMYTKRLNHFVRMGKELDAQELLDSLKMQRVTTRSERYSKTAKRTPDEVRKQLREEGIEQFTPEYRQAIEDVRVQVKGRPKNEQDKARKILMKQLDQRVERGELVRNNPDYVARKQELERTPVRVSEDVRDIGDIRPKETTEATTVSKYNDDVVVTSQDDPLQRPSEVLPKNFRDFETVDPYKVKSETTLRRLRDDIRKELVEPVRKQIDARQAKIAQINNVLDRTYNALRKNPRKVMERAIQSENINNVFVTIRASNTLAKQVKEAKAQAAARVDTAIESKRADVSKAPQDKEEIKKLWDELSKPLTEEDMFVLVHQRSQDSKTPKEMESIEMRAEKANEKALQEKFKEIKGALTKYVESGEDAKWQAAKKVNTWHNAVGRMLTVWTRDIARVLQNSKVTSIEYVGHRLTELGSGYGGQTKRNFTAGLRRHAVWQDLGTEWLPTYFRIMDDYANLNFEAGTVKRMNAQQMLGKDNKIVDAFNRDFMYYMEMMRQGKEIPTSRMKRLGPVIEFAKDWGKFTGKAHDYLVGSRIEGFTPERKQSYYVPRIHQYAKYQKVIAEHGEDKVRELIAGAIHKGRHRDLVNPDEKAGEFIEWIKGQDGSVPVEDLYMPAADTRSMGRLDMDMTHEVDGLSMFDLVNTEVKEIGVKYGNRVAGWSGMSDASDGLFNSNAAIDAYREVIRKDAELAGVSPDKYVTYFDDVINMLFGRPTRGGLATELRMMKDQTALTRMGGLGTAQLVESGQVITRSTMNLFSDPKVAKKIFNIAGEDINNQGLLSEIQALSRMTDDMEHFQMQSVNLDQAELARINKVREFSLRASDALTFGSYKAPASRLLGKVTGFNAIRKMQSRIAQSGFTMNAVLHFSGKKSQLSPARLADLGLSEVDGSNVRLTETINKYVEWGEDGLPTKLNVDKWPKEVRDEFQLAMLRDEAQNVQRALVGELPAWYNKPLMALIFQFRQFPLVANNKQLGRAFAFADKEAVMATMLNVASAGLVRFAKFATIAAGIATVSERDFRRPTADIQDMSKYVAQFGFFPDAVDLVIDAYKTYDDKGFSVDMGDKVLSTAPVWGLMKDYKDVATPEMDNRERIKAAFGLMPLGNTLAADMIHARLQQELKD